MTDVKTILELWFKLRETPKEQIPVYEISRNNPWDYLVKKDMEQAFELDPEGLTALLLLDNFRNDFFLGCGLRINDILENEYFEAFVADCRRLTRMLSEEHIVSALAEFVGNVSRAAEHMGVTRKEVTDMINDRYDMAVLRRDSLRSMEVLNLHQFFQGDTVLDHLTFLPDIHLFWNMNSLIRCAWQSPDGVSINLIQDPLVTSSYFAFVAKNGGNLTVLTDKPREAHPISKYMSRRPEKDFTRRVFRNHFPYGLMDLHYDHKGYLHPGKTDLVPLQEKPIRIGSVAQMQPDEIIWTIMMFSLIDGKLYKENYHCAELSYTSDMIQDPGIGKRLIEQNQAGALMVKGWKPLEAPVLTVADTDGDDQYVHFDGEGPNQWLYERYKDQIPDDILNGLIPDDESTLFLLPDDSTFLAPKERQSRPSSHLGADPVLLADPSTITWHTSSWGGKCTFDKTTVEGAVALKKMTGDEFGSKESLLQDYRWYARYNAAKFIRKKAEEEFKSREKEVLEWVRLRIEQNLGRIVKDIVYYCNLENKEKHPCVFSMTPMKGEWWSEISTFHTIPFAKDRKARYRRNGTEYYPFHNNADAGCWFSEDAPCSYVLKAQAYSLEDLLYLTGCKSAQELPDVLQHWKVNHGYRGNCILQRVDPMDWVAKTPWDELDFNPLIGIGKKYLSKVKKELGL